MITKTEANQKIHDYEYFYNGLQRLNNSGISVCNLKRIKGGYKADIILYIEDVEERYNGCEYKDKFFEEVKVTAKNKGGQ